MGVSRGDRPPARREVVFPALAAAVIAVSADTWIPLGLPGHRGLIWLTLLATVTLLARQPETVVTD